MMTPNIPQLERKVHPSQGLCIPERGYVVVSCRCGPYLGPTPPSNLGHVTCGEANSGDVVYFTDRIREAETQSSEGLGVSFHHQIHYPYSTLSSHPHTSPYLFCAVHLVGLRVWLCWMPLLPDLPLPSLQSESWPEKSPMEEAAPWMKPQELDGWGEGRDSQSGVGCKGGFSVQPMDNP